MIEECHKCGQHGLDCICEDRSHICKKHKTLTCPFCDSHKLIYCQTPNALCEVFIYCKSCFSNGPIKLSKIEALRSWNQRKC